VVPAVLHRFAQLINNYLRRSIGGIAHAQIDNVGALLTLGQLQGIQSPKKIGGQTLYSLCRLNLFVGNPSGVDSHLRLNHILVLQIKFCSFSTIGKSTPNR